MSSRRLLVALALISVSTVAIAQDWPQWRGPTGDNHAAPGATAPLEWSDQSGLAWKTTLPGRGNSSPTLVGDRIYLTTGDGAAATQSLLILDRATGELLKKVTTHHGGLPEEVQGKNSHANSSVASDGQRVFAMFLNDEAPHLTAYTLDGDQLWQQRVCGPTRVHFEYGFGSSPRVVNGLVIVATEFNLDGSGIYAFDAATGDRAWHTPRPKQFSYSSPAAATIDGKNLLLMCGNFSLTAYEAETGQELWRREGPTMATVGTMVWDAALGLGFASGGHPKQFTLAVGLSGDHQIVWQNPVKCYEQSLLVADGHLYAVSDHGVAYCWRGSDGREKWKKRLGGNFSSSPLLVGDKVYVTSEKGAMYVYEANPESFALLAGKPARRHSLRHPNAGRRTAVSPLPEGGQRILGGDRPMRQASCAYPSRDPRTTFAGF